MRIRRKGWMAIAAAAVSALVWLHPGNPRGDRVPSNRQSPRQRELRG